MNRDTKADLLRIEGINGLKMVSRDSLPLAPRTKIEPELINSNGDMRYSFLNNVYLPRDDYMIYGEGRPPLVVREVISKVQGMKRYALVDMRNVQDITTARRRLLGKKSRESYADVNYVYSEGVDFEKMIDDPAYAEVVISLFQEDRLNERREISKGNGSDVVYIGTIAEKDGEYVRMARPEYKTVIETIMSEIERKDKEEREARQVRMEEGSKETQKEADLRAAEEFAFVANRDMLKQVIKGAYEKFGSEDLKAMIKEVLTEIAKKDDTNKTQQECENEDGREED